VERVTVIEAEITFRSQNEIGRANPLVLDHPTARYRPHVTVNLRDSPTQISGEERLGVQFPPQSSDLHAGVPAVLRFHTLFRDVDCSALKPGVEFRILEGPLVVGTGRVIRVLTEGL
jgi:hypothetical protein